MRSGTSSRKKQCLCSCCAVVVVCPLREVCSWKGVVLLRVHTPIHTDKQTKKERNKQTNTHTHGDKGDERAVVMAS